MVPCLHFQFQQEYPGNTQIISVTDNNNNNNNDNDNDNDNDNYNNNNNDRSLPPRIRKKNSSIAPVVQTLESSIHRLNHYPADKY